MRVAFSFSRKWNHRLYACLHQFVLPIAFALCTSLDVFTFTVNAVASLVNGDELKVSTNVYSEWCTWEELAVYTSMPFRRVSFVRINTIGCATASKCIYCAALMGGVGLALAVNGSNTYSSTEALLDRSYRRSDEPYVGLTIT